MPRDRFVRRSGKCYICNGSACGRSRALDEHCLAHHTDIDSCLTATASQRWRVLDEDHPNLLVSVKGDHPSNRVNVMYCLTCYKMYEALNTANPIEKFKYHGHAKGIHRCFPMGGSGKPSPRKGIKKSAVVEMPTAAGGAGTAVPVNTGVNTGVNNGPSVIVNEAYLQAAYKEHGKTFEYSYNDDCSINVKESVERVFRDAFKVEGLLKNNRQLAADLTKARSTAPSTSGAADPDLILTMLKTDAALRAFVSQQETIKREAAENPIILDDDDETDVTPYDPFDVIKQLAHDAKRLAVVRKQMEQMRAENASAVISLEGQLAQASQQAFRLQQQLMAYQKDLSVAEQSLREHQAEAKRLREENEKLAWKAKATEE